MNSIGFYCDPNSIETNALDQLQQYAQKEGIQSVCAFTDIHYCAEKSLPVGVAFETADHIYPLITGKDIGCGVMYLKISKAYWIKPFGKEAHYRAFSLAHQKMTDDGLGGGNHFLSIEEDEENIYIICHTGTRDRGIAMYQHCRQMTVEYGQEAGLKVDYVHRNYLPETFWDDYNNLLRYGYERRKNFCIKTLIFLQNAHYVVSDKAGISRTWLQENFRYLDEEGILHGTPYMLEDSIHNHIRLHERSVTHRKGSTELKAGKTVVIPLSMSRGSLLVTTRSASQAVEALNSCAHGAGRRLSRFDAMKYWKTVLKEKERKAYKKQFSELLDRSGNFPSGYIQEFDFAYKDASDIMRFQPYLKMVAQTMPIVTVKYSEI